jgi:hypothetical protein
MKGLLILTVISIMLIGKAEAKSPTPVALVCGNGTAIFLVNLDKKNVVVTQQQSGQHMWSDAVRFVQYEPGFESLPPQTRIVVTTKSSGIISGMIVEKLSRDNQGLYKEVRGGKYKGRMSGNEEYSLGECELQLK